MSDQRDDPGRAAEAAVERALAAVPRWAPRAEFLRDLEVRFTSVASLRAVDAPAAGFVPARASVRPSSRPRFSGWAIAAGIAAVAASALAIFGSRTSDTLRWTPVAGHLPLSAVTVDGRSVSPAEFGSAVASGTGSHTIVTGTDPVWLQLGERVVCELAPGSEIELGPLSHDASSLVIAARKGTLRVCTGEEFVGSTLDVKTPDFELAITGTSFAVDIDEEGTCVCCLEGRVVMKAPDAFDETWAVDGGRMCRIYHDDRAPKWDELSHKHGPALAQFDELADELMK